MANYLESLMIEQFRGLRALELPGLGAVNLLVGANNSGKTSVLEAITTFCRPLDALEWVNTAWRREVKSSRTPLLDALKGMFPQTAEVSTELYTGETRVTGKARLVNLFDSEIVEAHATFSEFWGVGSPLQDADFTPSDELEAEALEAESVLDAAGESRRRGADIVLECRTRSDVFPSEPSVQQEKFQLWEGERFKTYRAAPGPQLPTATISPVAHAAEQLQIAQVSEALLSGIVRDEILSVLRLMDPGIQDLEILSRRGIRPALYLRHQETGLAPLSSFGDGIRRTLLIAVTLLQLQNGVLLIDELETAIHTAALQVVYRWLVRTCHARGIQLFATTHSLEAVDALLSVADEAQSELNVYRLERTPERTTSMRLDKSELTILREHLGQEVR